MMKHFVLDKVKTLIEQGLMKEDGLNSIEIAKENGSWIFLHKLLKNFDRFSTQIDT